MNMITFAIILLLLLLLVITNSELNIPKLIVYELSNSEYNTVILRANEYKTNLRIKYDILYTNEYQNLVEVCFSLYSKRINNKILFQNYCYDNNHNEIYIEGLYNDLFQLIASLQYSKNNQITELSTDLYNIEVINYIDILPKLAIIVEESNTIDELSGKFDLIILFALTPTLIPDLQICIKVDTLESKPILKHTCFESTRSSLILSGLIIGEYYIEGILFDANINFTFSNSLAYTYTSIKSVENNLPKIKLLANSNIIKAKGNPQADIETSFMITGYKSAIEQVNINVKLFSDDKFSISTNLSTSKSLQNYIENNTNNDNQITTIFLSNLTTGNHSIHLYFTAKYSPYKIFKQSLVIIDIEVNTYHKFIPTYTWQNVYPWNEPLQPGLEIRLPLNDEQILAKILDPFHLQVKMPPPCKYFLRTKVYKKMLIQDIVDIASRSCDKIFIPVNCIDIYSNETTNEKNIYLLLDNNLSVEESDLFNRNLFIHNKCV